MKRSTLLASNQLMVGIWNSIITADKERLEKKEKPPKDFKLRYGINKNLRLMEGELADIRKAGYEEYEQKRIPLIKEYAIKDEKGEVIVGTNGSMTLEKVDELNVKLEALQEEYKELFAFLDEECTFTPFLIAIDDIVLDIPLGPQDLTILEPFIRD